MKAKRIAYNRHSLGEYSQRQNKEAFFALVWLIEQINDWLFDFTNSDPNSLYLELSNGDINIADHTEIPSIIDGLIEDFKSVKLDTSELEKFTIIYRAIIAKNDLSGVLNQPMAWNDIGLKNGLYVNPNNPSKILTRVPLEYNEAVAIYANQYTNSIGGNMAISIPVWYVDKLVAAYLDVEYLLEASYPEYDSNIARHIYVDTGSEVQGLTHGFKLANASDYYALFTYIELHLPDYKFNTSEDPVYIDSFVGHIKNLCGNQHVVVEEQSILSLISDCRLGDKLTPKTRYITASGWQLFYMGNYFVVCHLDDPQFMVVAAKPTPAISNDELTETVELFLSPYAQVVEKQSFTEPTGVELKVINIYSYYIPELISLAQSCNFGDIHSVITIDNIVIHYEPTTDTTAKLYVFSQDKTFECRNQYILNLHPAGETND